MNVSELGLVTPNGKVVWGEFKTSACLAFCLIFNYLCCPTSPLSDDSTFTLLTCVVNSSLLVDIGKYAQVTNNPENNGCVNAVLLV